MSPVNLPIILNSGAARALILPHRGALVTSLVLDGTERLWMPADFAPNDTGWPGGGIPLLFPFAGRVFHQSQPFLYEMAGTVRTMPIHGFAYGMQWTVIKSSADSVLLATKNSAATGRLYPFAFELNLAVSLSETTLTIRFNVTHRGGKNTGEPMPVALGFHPYFKLQRDLASARLETSAATQVQVTPVGGAGKSSPLAPHVAAAQSLPLTLPMTANVILTDHAQAFADLIEDGPARGLRISWPGEPTTLKHLVLWRKEGEGFQCVEPWMGLPDAVQNGAGLAKLKPDESLAATMVLTAV